MKIAVVGAGISGLSAAYSLQARHQVVLFEQDDRLGGHTNTVLVPTDTDPQPVDTGWIVFNPTNYPNLTALFAHLGVTVRSSDMSFGVSLGDGAYEWRGSGNPLSFFAQPANAFKAAHWRLLRDILALNSRCRALLKAGTLPGGSLGDFLDEGDFGPELRSRYLLPMAGLIWSCSPLQAAQYPAADFMRFFDAHGLFATTRQPRWSTVVGGSHVYVQALLARFTGEVRRRAPVLEIRRHEAGCTIKTRYGEESFDAVVSAVHADQALRLLPDASLAERQVLGGIPYTRSRCVLHTDTTLMPRRRAAWASWNYLYPSDIVHDEPVTGSYWMNQLQGIQSATPYIVTLNPRRAIAEEHLLYETAYEHPFYGEASTVTHARLPSIQGRGRVYFAGAWTGYGFHEDGLASGLKAAALVDPACLPAWAPLPAPARASAREEELACPAGVAAS